MIRYITTIALVVGLLAGISTTAYAAPSDKDLAAAKKAYGEGKALYDKGKFLDAVSKYKVSYDLSKKPVLLFNIALAFEAAGEDDLALVNYKKFLVEAAADDAQRPTATEKVTALKTKLGMGTTVTPPNPIPTPIPTTNPDPVAIKPAGTYTAKDFQHTVIMEAPPSQPLDITAFVPEDSGWTVTLFFRGAGDTKFYTKAMKWRYKELVARIPGPKMGGQSIQYYVEVKDPAAKDPTQAVVTRSGKATSPNLVGIELKAPPRFYPDFSDDGTAVAATPVEVKRRDNEEDPLGKKVKPIIEDNPPIGPIGGEGPGPTDTFAGSSKFKYAKWGTTIGAATLVGLSLVFYVQAGSFAKALEDDAKDCPSGPPCKPYDATANDFQTSGQRYQLMSRVALGVGVATAGVAGYLWYRGMKAKKANAGSASPAAAPTGPAHDELSWIVAPSVGNGYAGASALLTF